ncbi:putative RNA-directed DNA polymerase [Helianthus debilis subsp. tardiflorus]
MVGNEKTEHCDFCGRDGHNRDGCFKRIGYPDWWPGKGKVEKGRPKAACVETGGTSSAKTQGEQSPITGLTNEQYQQFLNLFKSKDLSSRKLIGTGRCKQGLYRMEVGRSERMAMNATSDIWHKRLGHHSHSKISCFDFVQFKTNTIDCDSCLKAKFTRLPFPVSAIKSKECFDLLHCDIWVKYRKPSLTEANYFLTIVDDYSRSVWVFLLKHKSDASDCLIGFCKLIKTQFNKDVKKIRCDNGGEFTSNRMVSFYTKQGMFLETTCPHTPQQNGVVERKHRHLLETARALRFEEKLPTNFWGECILTVAHIINRLPLKIISNKTPYEMIYNEKPEYNNMRVFGCLAYYRNVVTNGEKFEVRGRPGIFVGYPRGTKGYKIYDVKNNKLVVTRDVRFIENTFPYEKMTSIFEDDPENFNLPTWYHEDPNLKNTVENEVYDKNNEEYNLHDSLMPNGGAQENNEHVFERDSRQVNEHTVNENISHGHDQNGEQVETNIFKKKNMSTNTQ